MNVNRTSILACGCDSACRNITILNDDTIFLYTPKPNNTNSIKKFDFIGMVNCSGLSVANSIRVRVNLTTTPFNCTGGSDVTQITSQDEGGNVERSFTTLDDDCEASGLIPNKTTFISLRRLYNTPVNISIECFNSTTPPRRQLLCGICNCNSTCDWVVGVFVGGFLAFCALLFVIWILHPSYFFRVLLGRKKPKKKVFRPPIIEGGDKKTT